MDLSVDTDCGCALLGCTVTVMLQGLFYLSKRLSYCNFKVYFWYRPNKATKAAKTQKALSTKITIA